MASTVTLFLILLLAKSVQPDEKRCSKSPLYIEKFPGSIASPNYPSQYPYAVSCRWIIVGPEGMAIRFRVEDLELETLEKCDYDHLKIFDGVSTRPTELARLCQDVGRKEFLTSSNMAVVEFKSDGVQAGRGFNISYSLDYPECNQVVRSKDGLLSSPGFQAKPYEDGLQASWCIKVAKGNVISLQFHELDIEKIADACLTDYVSVRDGQDVFRFCGSDPVQPWQSSTNQVNIIFKTDRFNDQDYRGFQLGWQTVGCNEEFSQPQGDIYSPTYGKPSGGSESCSYFIEAQPRRSIELAFLDVHLDCDNGDSIKIFDGPDNHSGILIADVCRTSKQNIMVTSSGRFLMLLYTKNPSKVPTRGFHAIYMIKNTGCGGRYVAGQGILLSPQYPMGLPHPAICKWHVQVDDGNRLAYTIEELSLTQNPVCNLDVLRIHDGQSTDKVLTEVCHPSRLVDGEQIASGNTITVVLQQQKPGVRFRLAFSSVFSKMITVQNGVPRYVSSVNDKNLKQQSWHLLTDDLEGRLGLVVYSLHLSTEDCTESLEIFSGQDEMGTRISALCSRLDRPTVFFSSSYEMFLRLRGGQFSALVVKISDQQQALHQEEDTHDVHDVSTNSSESYDAPTELEEERPETTTSSRWWRR